jgi:hypothetical protein
MLCLTPKLFELLQPVTPGGWVETVRLFLKKNSDSPSYLLLALGYSKWEYQSLNPLSH